MELETNEDLSAALKLTEDARNAVRGRAEARLAAIKQERAETLARLKAEARQLRTLLGRTRAPKAGTAPKTARAPRKAKAAE